jgi:hypothetical protein
VFSLRLVLRRSYILQLFLQKLWTHFSCIPFVKNVPTIALTLWMSLYFYCISKIVYLYFYSMIIVHKVRQELSILVPNFCENLPVVDVPTIWNLQNTTSSDVNLCMFVIYNSQKYLHNILGHFTANPHTKLHIHLPLQHGHLYPSNHPSRLRTLN